MSFSYIGKLGNALGGIIGFPKNFLFGLVWSAVMWVILFILLALSAIPLLPAMSGVSASTDPASMENVDLAPFAIFYFVAMALFVLLKPMGDLASLAYVRASIDRKSLGFLEFVDSLKAKFIPLLLANLVVLFSGILAIAVITIASSLALSLLASFSSDPLFQEIFSFAFVMLPLLLFFALVSTYLPFVFLHDRLEKGIIGSFIQCMRFSASNLASMLPLVVLVVAWNYFVLILTGIPFCFGSIVISLFISFLGWYVANYAFILILEESQGKDHHAKEKHNKK